jgi:hypothetical protein
MRKVNYYEYVWRSFKWTILNGALGLAPLIFMCIMSCMSEKDGFSHEITHLIRDGVHLFVCCALMGAVVVDFWLAGIPVSGMRLVFIYLMPVFVLIFLLFEYLLIYLRIAEAGNFYISSSTSIVVIGLSVLYCIFAKASLYANEDKKHEHRR